MAIESGIAVHVVNPGGRDADQMFPGGPGRPEDGGHPPVNYHAYAASTCGGFFRDESRVPAGAAIVLLRPRHLARAARAVERLQSRGSRVAVTVKEAGAAQFAAGFGTPARWQALCEVVRRADAFLAPTREMEMAFRGTGSLGGGFVPTPYPLEFPDWDFSCPLSARSGVFVGTREFAIASRHHLVALAALSSLRIPATVINTEGRVGKRLIREVSPDFRIIDGPLAYPDYLRLMASHRAVFQLDASRVPGQVAGDALLCRMPCIGGDSAVEQIAFGGIFDANPGVDGLMDGLQRVLADDAAWHAAVAESQARASEALCFGVIACRLREFLG